MAEDLSALGQCGKKRGINRRKRTGIELASDLDPNTQRLVVLGKQTLKSVRLRESLKLKCRHWHAGFA